MEAQEPPYLYHYIVNRYVFLGRLIEVSPIRTDSFFSDWGISVIIGGIKYVGINSGRSYMMGLMANKYVFK